MTFRLHLHHHFDDGISEVLHLLRAIHSQGEKIMATVAELTKQINDVTTELAKVQGETTTLLTKISDLQAVINSGNFPVPPELQTAVDALTAQAKVVDDLVPDAPTP